jgi:hypothetical protein
MPTWGWITIGIVIIGAIKVIAFIAIQKKFKR